MVDSGRRARARHRDNIDRFVAEECFLSDI
jgi:hypothetical protein